MEHHKALLIFVKNPIPGKYNAGLAAMMGNELAVWVNHKLLRHTYRITRSLQFRKSVYYADYIPENDVWQESLGKYYCFMQKGQDLGERMRKAFQTHFEEGFTKVVLIGCDNADIQTHHIKKAFEALDSNDVVLGPSKNGGFYLLGMRKMLNGIFYNLPWHTPHLLASTLKDLDSLSVKYTLMEQLAEVNVYEGYENAETRCCFDVKYL